MPVTVVEGRRLTLTNLDKVLYPATGTTKGELVHYYTVVASALLPHLRDRPVSFVRYPDGPSGGTFVAKHLPQGTPAWVATAATPSRSRGEPIRQVLIQDLPTLVWAANLVAELHTPQWREDAPGMADRLVFDLDPGAPADILACRDAARLLRDRLAADGLTAYPKTSGSKGLHLLVPIEATPSAEVTAYAKTLAEELSAENPRAIVAKMTKSARPGRVFVDFSQNAAAKTTASPYTARARDVPMVSTPVTWDELNAATTADDLVFTIDDVPERVREHGDLLAPMLNPRRAGTLPVSSAHAPRTRGAHSAKARRTARPAAPAPTKPADQPSPPTVRRALEPPVAVMRPKAVRDVPAEDALPGGTQYSLKLDGWRALAFIRGDEPPVLQARSKRDLAPGFPEVHDALRTLPDGVVLDGELCAWHEDRFAFGQLIRSPAARARDGAHIAYVAFDLLALPGHDIRDRPLRERWDLLTALLADAEPPLQLVMATNDRDEALSWRTALAPTGVEGLVAKGLGTPYAPMRHGGWLKIRDTDTIDVRVTAFSGTPRRPRTLVTELSDGTEALTSPQLDSRQAREVAATVANRTAAPVPHPDLGSVHPITPPTTAEVLRAPGRSPYVRFIRLRED